MIKEKLQRRKSLELRENEHSFSHSSRWFCAFAADVSEVREGTVLMQSSRGGVTEASQIEAALY